VAKETTVILRCDVCGTTEGVEEYEIKRNGQKRAVDLCENDGAPLVKLFELGTAPTKAPARVGRPSSHAVIPIEDWDGSSN
jgi:hypothetical protein